MTPERERVFWSRVIEHGGCWLWIGGRIPEGYGAFWDVDTKRNVGAHRVSYELVKGPIADGLHVDHACRNRSCVRPDHLEAVTPWENGTNRSSQPQKVARRTNVCFRGHPLTEGNVYRTTRGRRTCRTCNLYYAPSRRDRRA